MVLTLRAVTVTTGMIDTVLLPTVVALIQTVTIMPALALLDGADNLTVCKGQLGVVLQVFWSKGGADLAKGCHEQEAPFLSRHVVGLRRKIA